MARHEKGQILLLTLIILTIGAIIMGSLLIYLNTSMSASEKSEERAMNYYAADSGFEDGYFFLQQDKGLGNWTEMGEDQWEREPYTINNNNGRNNGRTVFVSVNNTGDDIYKITSTARIDGGESTIVESYVLSKEYGLSFFGDDVITSNCSVDIAPLGGQGDQIQGNVTYVCDIECLPKGCDETINGTYTKDPDGIDWWPPTQLLIDEFSDEVDKTYSFPDYRLYVNNIPNIGPLYREGDLYIQSKIEGANARLSGIVYVTGDLIIGGAKGFTLNLSGQTIFVEGTGGNQPAIVIDKSCTIEGSGFIIALGDIKFLPNVVSGENDFVFIMSAEGGVTVQPLQDFYGSIAGHDYVDVQPNVHIEHNDPEGIGFVFPDVHETILDVKTYNIKK